VAPELPRAGRGSPSRGDTWRPRSCPEPGAGDRAAGTRGGPELSRAESGEPELWGHVAASELPSARRREPLSWLEACAQGYPVLRVPTVAPGPTSGEATNPRVGPTSFPHAAFLSLYVLGFRSGGAARLIRGDPRLTQMLRCSWNRHAPQFLVGRYCSVEIMGPKVIMTMIPEPTGLRTYGMCRDSVSAPTDEQGLDPLVNVWVCGAHGVGMKCHARWVRTHLGG
jgi:hypothetical protein